MTNLLINVSNHTLSAEQVKDFDMVVELPQELKVMWGQITPEAMVSTVEAINEFIKNTRKDHYNTNFNVHIAGHAAACYQLANLTTEMCIFAHSVRNSIEEVQEDGSTIKKAIFKHTGWFTYGGNPL